MSFQGLFESVKKRKQRKIDSASAATDRRSQQPQSRLSRPNAVAANDNLQAVNEAHSSNQSYRDKKPGGSFGQKRKRQPVSQDALALSAQLKDLSRQKRLNQVLRLYWNAKDRDAHHACMVIDCCARCGYVAEAERVFQEADNACSVEMHTALLKAFAHAGHMAKADSLFARMCEQQSRIVPNVRTLNTLLRGCLWTAACLHGDSIVGGIVTSERAWNSYIDRVGEQHLDASSYEYSISLLCQALRMNDAKERIGQFMDRYQVRLKGKASFRDGDQTALETLAVVYLSLAKSYGLLQKWDDAWVACQRVLNAVEGSRAQLVSETTSLGGGNEVRHKQATGGKKSWNSTVDGHSQRSASNTAFRCHRLSELEMEARAILKLRNTTSRKTPDNLLSSTLLTRLLYFSGGGTTELDGVDETIETALGRQDQQRRLLIPAYYSFGLASLVSGDAGNVVETGIVPNPETIYNLAGVAKVMKKLFHNDGRVDLDRVFSASGQPVDLELGSGFGEWISAQAQANSMRNYIAVELRADRVSHILVKSTLLLGLRNVCVVGSDGASFLRLHVPAAGVSNVYVNYPEPPTQTFGDNMNDLKAIMDCGSEPAHMLCSSTLVAISDALRPGGKLCIISDNRWYSRLICATFAKANRSKKCNLMSPSPSEAKDLGLRFVESFENGATLYQSMPRSDASCIGEGKTWFDRLWQTGAGRHAERTIRYAIIVHKQ